VSSKIRVVAPFRPFPPESGHHLSLQDFDWMEALQMMAHSAAISCRCPVHAITDVDTELPIASLRYETKERRLMLWTLEACIRYLQSNDFDRDTVMLDVDQLIYRDLAPFFHKRVDLGVLIRPQEKHAKTGAQPMLNGVQFWRRESQTALVKFYKKALDLAKTLPEERIVWGADTDALLMLLQPLDVTAKDRSGVTVRMFDSSLVLESFSTPVHQAMMERGEPPWPEKAVLDFRSQRKRAMPKVYRATYGAGAVR
jgi:hypothetical protein